MKKFLIVLAAAVGLAFPALAQQYNTSFGAYVGLAQVNDATYSAVDFGFRAAYVEVCLEDDSSRSYIRFDDALPANATSSANFITDPNTGEQALPLFGSGDGTDVHCIGGNWAVPGVVVHSAGNASLDVRAYK